MNNAILAMQVSHPATTTPSSGSTATDAQHPGAFDAALDAAHADVRKGGADATSTRSASTASQRDEGTPATRVSKAGKPSSSDEDSKDDDKDDAQPDTSVAASVLALLGVTRPPVQPTGTTDVVPSGQAPTTDATSTGVPAPALATLGTLDPAALAARQAALKTAADPTAATAPAVAAAAPTEFAAAFGTQLAAASTDKDDTVKLDVPAPSPMPVLHTGTSGSQSVLQVQATQPATTPQFAQQLGEQIAWMGSSGDIKEARIKLHPEELGSMDVRVNVDGSKVNVAIMAQHPAAVHAVQQTLSQLDTLLAHHGLSLGQADVGQRQAGDGSAYGQASGQAAQDGAAADDVSAATSVVSTSSVSRSLVDERA
jgi:flagellar hook-length control protein FliK